MAADVNTFGWQSSVIAQHASNAPGACLTPGRIHFASFVKSSGVMLSVQSLRSMEMPGNRRDDVAAALVLMVVSSFVANCPVSTLLGMLIAPGQSVVIVGI